MNDEDHYCENCDERVLRIEDRFDNLDIYVRHLDNNSTPATIEGFIDKFQNQKLIFLPVIETKKIAERFSNCERLNEDEIFIAINRDHIYSITYDTLPCEHDNNDDAFDLLFIQQALYWMNH
jgi:hypothetical protein